MQNDKGLQGVQARAKKERWADDATCTDLGHIDWLLSSTSGTHVKAHAVCVCTELVCPPLQPRRPEVCKNSLPSGGAFFASDHYPVFADVEL